MLRCVLLSAESALLSPLSLRRPVFLSCAPTCFWVNATPQAPVRKICFLGPAVSVIELMWDGAWCPQGLVPCGLPAPYLCVSCFPASASNGRSWFSSSAFSSEYFSTSQGQPSGKQDVHAASSDSCSVEHGFKINVIPLQNVNFAICPPDPWREPRQAERKRGWTLRSCGAKSRHLRAGIGDAWQLGSGSRGGHEAGSSEPGVWLLHVWSHACCNKL